MTKQCTVENFAGKIPNLAPRYLFVKCNKRRYFMDIGYRLSNYPLYGIDVTKHRGLSK